MNIYTWTVTCQSGGRVEAGVYSALFVSRETQVFEPVVLQQFKNAKIMRCE